MIGLSEDSLLEQGVKKCPFFMSRIGSCLAPNLLCFAFLLGELELFDESSVVHRRALSQYRDSIDPEEIPNQMSGLARHLGLSSTPTDALPVFREVINIRLEHQDFAGAFYDLANMGALLMRLGRWQEAIVSDRTVREGWP